MGSVVCSACARMGGLAVLHLGCCPLCCLWLKVCCPLHGVLSVLALVLVEGLGHRSSFGGL